MPLPICVSKPQTMSISVTTDPSLGRQSPPRSCVRDRQVCRGDQKKPSWGLRSHGKREKLQVNRNYIQNFMWSLVMYTWSTPLFSYVHPLVIGLIMKPDGNQSDKSTRDDEEKTPYLKYHTPAYSSHGICSIS